MSDTISRPRQVRWGTDQVPRRLWDLHITDDPRTNGTAIQLLGFMHSCTDDYLERQTVTSLSERLGYTRETVRAAITSLANAGFLTVARGRNNAVAVVLDVDAWEALGWRDTRQPVDGIPSNQLTGIPSTLLEHKTVEEKQLSSETADAVGASFEADQEFVQFWSLYPNKAAKKTAFRAWRRLSKANRSKALASASVCAGIFAAKKREARFFPQAATFLNGDRWEDPEFAPKAKSSPPANQPAFDPDKFMAEAWEAWVAAHGSDEGWFGPDGGREQAAALCSELMDASGWKSPGFSTKVNL